MPLSRSAGALNTGVFNRIVRTAAWSGILAGLLLTAVQQVQVSGIILQAEVYEDAAAVKAASSVTPAPLAPPVMPADSAPVADAPGTAPHSHAAPKARSAPALAAPAVAHEHADGAAATAHAADAPLHDHVGAAAPHEHTVTDGAGHTHEHGGWQPENGVERTFFTVLANMSMAVAFGLLLAAGFCLRGAPMSWRAGLAWGAAGYAVFFLAPSLGLPPEVPGTLAAPLAARQIWWLMTAVSTASALAMLTHSRNWAIRIAGVALLAAPHVIGAPQALEHGGAAPAELARAFIYATAIANAVFWLALGGLAGWFYKKYD